MKCAEAKTRLSFVTATLNSLRAGIASSPCRGPAALDQRDEDRGGGEVRRGAGVFLVRAVARLALEGRDAPGAAGLRPPAGRCTPRARPGPPGGAAGPGLPRQ